MGMTSGSPLFGLENAGGYVAGETVAVLGPGPIGLMAIQSGAPPASNLEAKVASSRGDGQSDRGGRVTRHEWRPRLTSPA